MNTPPNMFIMNITLKGYNRNELLQNAAAFHSNYEQYIDLYCRHLATDDYLNNYVQLVKFMGWLLVLLEQPTKEV